MKTAIEMEQMIYNAISDEVTATISGGFYPEDCRPFDSKAEDAVLAISTLDAEQIQTGIAVLNVYVQDLFVNGRNVPDKARLKAVSELAEKALKALANNLPQVQFEAYSAPQIIANDNGTEHFVNITIKFNLLSEKI